MLATREHPITLSRHFKTRWRQRVCRGREPNWADVEQFLCHRIRVSIRNSSTPLRDAGEGRFFIKLGYKARDPIALFTLDGTTGGYVGITVLPTGRWERVTVSMLEREEEEDT